MNLATWTRSPQHVTAEGFGVGGGLHTIAMGLLVAPESPYEWGPFRLLTVVPLDTGVSSLTESLMP